MIRARGLSSYELARDADVDPGVIQRFVSGRRDIRLESADRLAGALGLRLVESGSKGRGKTRTTDGPPAIAPGRPPEAPEADHDDFTADLNAEEVYRESDDAMHG